MSGVDNPSDERIATRDSSRPAIGQRAFDFARDTFAYANETRWIYGVDESGEQTTASRDFVPEYSLRCFPVVRAAKQFFLHARFAPDLPVASDAEYGELIRQVVRRNVRAENPSPNPVVIPGFAGLRAFSEAKGDLLKAGCGTAWRSYFQRGNWRMVFPVWRGHQSLEAERLLARLRTGLPEAVHVFRFPQLTINHALLAYAAEEVEGEIRFTVYDPNIVAEPQRLTFERGTREFLLPRNHYFKGGQVELYRVYQGWLY